jgi:hypothetical protein
MQEAKENNHTGVILAPVNGRRGGSILGLAWALSLVRRKACGEPNRTAVPIIISLIINMLTQNNGWEARPLLCISAHPAL